MAVVGRPFLDGFNSGEIRLIEDDRFSVVPVGVVFGGNHLLAEGRKLRDERSETGPVNSVFFKNILAGAGGKKMAPSRFSKDSLIAKWAETDDRHRIGDMATRKQGNISQ